ncbi:hypothetical protein [Euzebya tangerina]|uniref:hypothetical protein n=1 Tax=Euzebya tangerina TaxID=591198 RepID=UPI000E31691D|nr:hypothetical protein [Euzebya tangerina]
MTPAEALADQLLAAHVEHVVGALLADDSTSDLADGLLAVAAGVPLQDLLSAERVTTVVLLLLERVPPSTTASTLVATWATAVHEGPDSPVTAADLMTRDQTAALVAEFQRAVPALRRAVEQMADSPVMGQLASGFLARVVTDVVAANRSVAERIPGMGGILSLGDRAASAVMGAAEVPMQLVGDTAGKGAAVAVRRLAAIVADTLEDPAFHLAALEVWDRASTRRLGPAGATEDGAPDVDDVRRVAGLLQDLTITASTSPPVQDMAAAFVASFYDVYGEYPVTTLLEEMGLTTDEITAAVRLLVRRFARAANEHGLLESLVNDQLEPFYRSSSTIALIDEAVRSNGDRV